LFRRIIELSTLAPLRPTTTIEEHEKLQKLLIGVLRGVVAIAEQGEEKLRLAALETLGELG
jgi:hypothetical protein